ncbi:TrbM/KikA/MpfK family conjugal transfer protein [Microvirgula aerodenitrificans]|uniref:TrbM/KikA/MpfK family conjugal transfer protein n=1 Tax=Microvirgula aerodenitrificans TaxID=57480 RepID=UPI00248F45CB|nr:TrbM/KikA/MpfK family conjugal transfer protein [Microvirgula aerodenitrificans]
MKRLAITSVFAAMTIMAAPAQADDLFTGDVRLACEAVLCLSSGTRPSECAPSLQRYFSISAKKMSDTIKKRKSFLNLCPAASQDEKMASLVDAITNGAGRCDYASLNSSLRSWRRTGDGIETYIRNSLPSYCTAYNNNAYTDIKEPRYVGVPERGGHWVDADKYDAALAEYNKRIAAEDEARRRAQSSGYFGNRNR